MFAAAWAPIPRAPGSFLAGRTASPAYRSARQVNWSDQRFCLPAGPTYRLLLGLSK